MKIRGLWRPEPWLALAVAVAAVATRAQGPAQTRFAADQMDTFLYGAAFYEEYMPQDRLETDVRLMEQAGINVVRVGESTWSLWEPEDGRFEFAWMDRIIERLARAHIRVILGTPTYSIPPWMFKKHPGDPGDAAGWPKSHLRDPPEYGHHEPGFSALFRACHSQDHRTLPRQPGRNRLPGGQ